MGEADFGAVRVGFFARQVSADLNLPDSREEFLKNGKIPAGPVIGPFDFKHDRRGFVSGNQEIDFAMILGH